MTHPAEPIRSCMRRSLPLASAAQGRRDDEIDSGCHFRVIEAVARADISARHAARPFRSEELRHHLFGKGDKGAVAEGGHH